MRIESNRFGGMDLDEADAITFAEGLVGFPDEDTFVLLRHRESSPIGWLQSTRTPSFALPVVSLEALEAEFDVGLLGDDFDAERVSVMAVLSAGGGLATVNLLAPILVDVETRQGKQTILTASDLTSQTPFALRKRDAPQAETETEIEDIAKPEAVAA